jgi:hypothetical protein
MVRSLSFALFLAFWVSLVSSWDTEWLRVFALGENSELYTSLYTRDTHPGNWKRISSPSSPLKQISAGQDGRIWGVDGANQVWTVGALNGTWQLKDGSLKQVAVGSDGRVWGINNADQVFTRAGVSGSWQPISGTFQHVSVSPNGIVYGVSGNQLWTRAGVDGTWKLLDASVQVQQTSVGGDGRVWAVDRFEQVWTRGGVSGAWQKIRGSFRQISVAHNGMVWAVNRGGSAYFRDDIVSSIGWSKEIELNDWLYPGIFGFSSVRQIVAL